MICPSCGCKNLMGAESCRECGFDLSALDLPMPTDAVERTLMTDPVSTLRPRKPVTVLDTADLGQAMQLMMASGVGAVLVTDADGRLVGILTERDFLTKVAGSALFALLPVRQFMTPNPETVQETNPLAFALRMMDVGGYRHLPVVNGDKPIGVISVRDVLRHVLSHCHPLVRVK